MVQQYIPKAEVVRERFAEVSGRGDAAAHLREALAHDLCLGDVLLDHGRLLRRLLLEPSHASCRQAIAR